MVLRLIWKAVLIVISSILKLEKFSFQTLPYYLFIFLNNKLKLM